MGIMRADFDGVVAALGFPSEKERNHIENQVAKVAELCDLAYIYIPFLQALYATYLNLMEAKGDGDVHFMLDDFLGWLDQFENPGNLFALERVFTGSLIHHPTVESHFYTEKESVFLITDSERPMGYVRIEEEIFYESSTAEVMSINLYINAL